MLFSRAESAQYLAEKLPIRSAPEWHTFLNDNARNRNGSKIKFKSNAGVGGKTFYEQTVLNEFIESLKPPIHLNRAEKVMEVYGIHHEGNRTTEGRFLGWRDFKFAANPISPEQRDDGISIQVHIQTGSDSDLRVGALTLAETKAWIAELTEVVGVAERTAGKL